ncbi:MAG: DUF296 domain-containing protein [Deltaproteobacteria bacterium]|nr:DUF296 domain-containing protein [Deltaproteobacteria bacterium]
MRVFGAEVVDRFRMRLEHGDELPRRLEEELARRGCETAVVVGTGSLERADLTAGGGRPPIELADCELVSLTGEVSLRSSGRPVATLRVVLSSRGEPSAGVLVHGVARDVLLVVDAFEAEPVARPAFVAPPVEVSRRGEPIRTATPVPAATTAAPAPRADAPSPVSGSASAGPSWAEVAAASAVEQQRAVMEETYARMASAPQPAARPMTSARPVTPARPVAPAKPVAPKPTPIATSPAPPVPEALRAIVPTKVRRGEEILYEDPIPEPGDYLEHPQFGLCSVEGEDDGGGIFIRIPSGARKSIKLDLLHVLPAVTDEQGRRVLKIVGPRRKPV